MSGLFRIFGAAVLSVALASVFKERNRNISVFVSSVAAVVLFSGLIGSVSEIVSFIKTVGDGTKTSSYVPVLLKAIGFTFLSEIISGICRSAGEERIASVVTAACRCEILALSIPYLKELLDLAIGMLK